MSTSTWIGCLRIPDVSAWALHRAGAAEDPFVVVERDRVMGASRTPRRAGVEPGMTRLRATSLCEEAAVVPRDPGLEAVRWEEVLEAINTHTPRIESERPGRAWFEPQQGEALREWLGSTPYHCGVGPSRPVALLAAWKAAAGRIICIEEAHREAFLDRMPVEVLAEVGFSEELAERLRLFGYETVGAARALSERHLDAQFAAEGERLHAFLHPEPERVSFYSPPPSVVARRTFEREVGEPGPLREALEEAATGVQERLGTRACQRLILRLSGRGEEASTGRVLREPTADAGTLARVGSTLLDTLLEPEMEIEALALVARGLQAEAGAQADLFRKRPALRSAVATVQKKHPNALYQVQRNRGAVFEENRFTYEPVSLD